MIFLDSIRSRLLVLTIFWVLLTYCPASSFHLKNLRSTTWSKTYKQAATSTSTGNEGLVDMEPMLFGRFKIPKSHVFLETKFSFGFVNLRPIVPGHVLVSSKRVVPRLSDLNDEEYSDLWSTVRATQTVLERKHGPSAFNVAVQDGAASGQSVPHVHVHILPRAEGDFERNDDVYDELQEWAPLPAMSLNKAKLEVPEDTDRKDRTTDQMAEEATSYRNLTE